MLGSIPKFYTDELLYSFLVRLKKYYFIDLTTLSKILFAQREGNYNPLFPRYLNKVSLLLEKFGYDSETILNHHTIAPLYRHFQSKKRYAEFKNNLLGVDNPYVLHPKPNPSYISISTSSFKYCTLCCEEDMLQYGETFIRRSHNIPEIEICITHNTFLNTFSFNFQGNSYYKVFDINEIFTSSQVVQFNRSRLIYNLATDLIQALTNQITPSISELKQTGQKKGFYKKINDSIYFDRTLYSDFLNYTSYNSRTMFAMVAENHQRLIKMMKGTWSGNRPILFFLVNRYLQTLPDRPASKIKNLELKCINKYCPDFNLKPIPSFFKYFDGKKNYGHIGKCESCGLEYEFSPSRTFRRILIRKIGPLMEKKIDELKEKHSYKKIAKIIGISKHIVLKFLRHHSSNKTEQGLLEKREQYRNKWTFEISKLKSIYRTSQKHWGIYTWLLKNDRDWIDKINSKYRITNRSHYRKNNNVKKKLLLVNDQMALKELQEIVTSLNAQGQKMKFTKSFLASKTSFKKYEAIKKLPKSNEFVLMHTSSST